jgi:gliding motility-associated-like protein
MLSSFEITIFNRWGEQIYRSFDMDNGWDGTFGKNVSPDGIYFYTVKYRDVKFKPFLIEGMVTLIR